MILGIDVSTYLEEKNLINPIYKRNDEIIDPFLLFKNNGVTHIRTRIWNNPYDEDGNPYLGGTCDLNNFLLLAETLKPYGFKHMVDFHYSDFWVDPSKQMMPKEWVNLSLDELKEKVYEFTKDSLMKIKEKGIDVEYIQTGNEITHGMLWPLGRIDNNLINPYINFASLLKVARKACKEIYPNAKVIIHFEEAYNTDLYYHLIKGLLDSGLEIDIIGTSYYPVFHHSFDEYFKTIDMIQKEFNIPVMNVETSYPFTLEDYKKEAVNNLVVNHDSIKEFCPNLPFVVNPIGQALYVKRLIELANVHHLEGIFYWEPMWIPGEGICWSSINGQIYQKVNKIKGTRNEWSNQCLFDYEGNALPAIDEYKI